MVLMREGGLSFMKTFFVLSFDWPLCLCCAKWKGCCSEKMESCWWSSLMCLESCRWETDRGTGSWKEGQGDGRALVAETERIRASARKGLECLLKSFYIVIWAVKSCWKMWTFLSECTNVHSYKLSQYCRSCCWRMWRAIDRVRQRRKEMRCNRCLLWATCLHIHFHI